MEIVRESETADDQERTAGAALGEKEERFLDYGGQHSLREYRKKLARSARNDNLMDLLRGQDVFAGGFDLDGGEAGGVPSAAEGFDEEDAGD